MNDDIVTRLRNKYSGHLPICSEAADEIERLREGVKGLDKLVKSFSADRDRWRKIAKGEHYAWSQCSYDCDCLTDIYKKAVCDE